MAPYKAWTCSKKTTCIVFCLAFNTFKNFTKNNWPTFIYLSACIFVKAQFASI